MGYDLNQLFRPTNWDDIIGQEDVKQIIRAAIASGNFPRFSIFCGPTGIGKSCTAEIVGRELVRTSPEQKQEDLDKHVIKYNMAKLLGKKDIVSILDDIFKFEGLYGKTVYILEEVQVLKQSTEQSPFLEELTRIPEDVYIIMCTTHVHKLLPALRNRATTFQLSVPSTQECVEMIKRIVERLGLRPMTSYSMQSLAKLSQNTPRSILKHMQLLIVDGQITQDSISKFFKQVSSYHYIECLGNIVDNSVDVYSFVKYLESLADQFEISQVLIGLRNFVLTALIEVSTGAADPSLSRSDRQEMSQIMSKISSQEFIRVVELIGKISSESYSDENEAKYKLIMLKLQLLNKTTSQLVKENKSLAISERAQAVHKSKVYTQSNMRTEPVTTKMSDSEFEAILGHLGDI